MNDLSGTEAVLCRYRYDALDRLASVDSGAYGHRSQENALLGFNGEYPEPVTGHYLLGNGYRAYNPVLMRFNQPDSLSPFGQGGLNAYAYCQGDPVNRRDPSGHISGPWSAGMSMFAKRSIPKVSPLQNLPNEMFREVIVRTPGSSLTHLANTSHGARLKVWELSIIPTIDIRHPQALQKIQQDVMGETLGVLPARIKTDLTYKARFEGFAEARKPALAAELNDVQGRIQEIRNQVAGAGASQGDFSRLMALRARAHAAPPNIRAGIRQLSDGYARLSSREIELMLEGSSIDMIRHTLNS